MPEDTSRLKQKQKSMGAIRNEKTSFNFSVVLAFTGTQGLAQTSDVNVFQPDDKADGAS